jgi:hypothetical protein
VPDPAPTPAGAGHGGGTEPLDTEPLMALRPESPREVVGLADQHLGVDKDTVVARANELLGPAEGGRSTEELTFLWQSLVDEFAVGDAPPPPPIAAVPDPVPAPPSVAPDPAGEMAPYSDPGPDPAPDPGPEPEPEADPDDIDLHDLVDAPAHTEQFIEKVTEAFPGAELHVPQEPTE